MLPSALSIQARRAGFAFSTCAGLLVACQSSGHTREAYVPRSRAVTITTVPLLVKEQQTLFPFLKSAFAAGGVLAGKEVYAFSPSTITAVEGDTLQLTLINPEDDEHSFVLPTLAVALPAGTITHATYVARRAGVYPIVCAVASHLPMMSGQLVVLSAESMAAADTSALR